jgi:subtilase family serine protease
MRHQIIGRVVSVVAALALAGPFLAAQQEPVAHPPFRVKVGGAGPMATTSPTGLSPATVQSVYSLPATGGSGTIAIVDAFDDPQAENDLNVFSTQFGLPPCTTANGCFDQVHAQSGSYRVDQGWALETALDIEWAHALAPNAHIMLVEAKTNSFANLLGAVDYAVQHGASIVSMSWGGSEFSSETGYDSHFQASGVVFTASSGDTGGAVTYPSSSPYVVSVGGTTLNFGKGGTFSSETAWSGSGGGPSAVEPRPSYQSAISGIVGAHRGTPDVSFDGDPNSGVSMYDSTGYHGQSGWFVVGGTSVGAPCWAAVITLAGGSSSSTAENTTIYGQLPSGYGTTFRDITSGAAGSFTAGTGWDFVTGVGSPLGLNGK